ncbi:MAG: hypothetical protein FJZ58_03400 [Chlamydiae bacterium]|nr:hypothetical protein [Chlamydiota bacterium]
MSQQPEPCKECTKPARALCNDQASSCTKMCDHCPFLEEKLSALTEDLLPSQERQHLEKNLLCAICHTSLYEIQTGRALGCSECFVLFGHLLMEEILTQNTLSSYGQLEDNHNLLFASYREHLAILHKQLEEALDQEQYEQAAVLRDQLHLLSQK